MKVVGAVLAAGQGRRLGGPKALLPLGGSTFLERAAAALRRPGVAQVLAVAGPEAERVGAIAAALPWLAVVLNPRHADGMLTSIWCALDAAEAAGADALLLHPVDHPLVAPACVDRVVEALARGRPIAVPSWEGRRGHPGGFARPAWPALRAASAERGARAVLADHPDWIEHVPGEPGCVAGIDTPADYERLVGPRP